MPFHAPLIGRAEDRRRGAGDQPADELSLEESLQRRRKLDAVAVAVMLALVTLAHTLADSGNPAVHDLLRRLYYIPILYAAFAFGLRGGLIAAAASTLLFFPHAQALLGGVFGRNLDNLFEIVMFFVMGGLFGRLRDVDARRTGELLEVSGRLDEAYHVLEQRAMQLLAVQDYTQSILRSVTSAVITVSPDGSIATVNPAGERLIGTEETALVARPLSSAFKDDGGLAQEVENVLGGATPRSMHELTLTLHDGRMLQVQVSMSRMKDSTERGLGAVVTVEDVTQLRALAEQLVRADRLAALGELTAGVAHEVRNPLGVIRASVQLMEEGEGSAARLKDASRVIKQEIDRLDRVVKSLLDFGRPSTPAFRRVRVGSVLEEVVLFTREFAGSSDVEIAEDIGDRAEVMADPEQLKQVFVNLIANAVQAMSETGGTLRVSTDEDAAFVNARFADDGPGIAPGDLGKVFDPFFSLREGGTGLGLTIVHRIIDEHGGHIEVTSDVGKGTTFTVSLPAVSGSVEA